MKDVLDIPPAAEVNELPPLPATSLAEIRNDSIGQGRLSETGTEYWGSNWREVRNGQMRAYARADYPAKEALHKLADSKSQTKGAAVAWMLTGSSIYEDEVFMLEETADYWLSKRAPGCKKVPLYAAPQAPAVGDARKEDLDKFWSMLVYWQGTLDAWAARLERQQRDQATAVGDKPLTGQAMRKAFEANYRKRHDSRLYCESEWRGWQAGVAACISGEALSKPPLPNMTAISIDSFCGAIGELKRGRRTVLDGLRALDRDPRVSTFERGSTWLERLLHDLTAGGYVVEEHSEPYPWHRYVITDKGRALLARL